MDFIRFLARFMSFVALAAAIVVGVIDSIGFVATALLKPMTIKVVVVWLGTEPEGLPVFVDGAGRGLLNFVVVQPVAPVLLVLSLLFWMAGYRRPTPFRPFATIGA